MKEIDPHLPIDKTAALVVSKSGHQGFDFRNGNKITSMSPLPTRQFSGPRHDDLTGKTFGDFTVIGCALFVPKNHLTSRSNSVRWVARCRCGRYQIFTTKAVRRERPRLNDGVEYKIACVECEKTRNIRRKNWAVIDMMSQKEKF